VTQPTVGDLILALVYLLANESSIRTERQMLKKAAFFFIGQISNMIELHWHSLTTERPNSMYPTCPRRIDPELIRFRTECLKEVGYVCMYVYCHGVVFVMSAQGYHRVVCVCVCACASVRAKPRIWHHTHVRIEAVYRQQKW
jgi:hypothetical protein